jgi:hypothetical protein
VNVEGKWSELWGLRARNAGSVVGLRGIELRGVGKGNEGRELVRDGEKMGTANDGYVLSAGVKKAD